MMNKKAVFDAYLLFIISGLFIVFIAAFAVPFSVNFNSKIYAKGDELIRDANDTISQISDSEAKTSIMNTFSTTLGAEQENIEITTQLFKYSWIIVTLFVFIIMFLYARQRTESSSLRGGGYI